MTREEAATREARDRRMAALWYAWGQQAAGVARDVDADAFAREHSDDALAYYNERTSWLPSVTDAWRTYCARQGVML